METAFPSLDTIKEYSTILATHQWPLVVIIVLLIFRSQLISLLNRIESYKGPGVEVAFGKSTLDKQIRTEVNTPSSTTTQVGTNWNKVSNVFWLGHDLMWTIDVIFRGAPGTTIVHGLRQSLYHLKELPLSNTLLEQKLQKLLADAQGKLEKEWTRNEREALAIELRALIDEISRLADAQQRSALAS